MIAHKKAQALICSGKREFALCEIDIPDLRPTDILIKTLYSGISIGTELLLITGKHNWGPFPICTGYQAVGIIERIGPDVTEFNVGDKVYYRGWNVPMKSKGIAVTPASGAHSSYAVVDARNVTHGAGLLPDNIDAEEASLFVMPAVGLNGINMAGIKGGDKVAVIGVGLIGLGVVACASLRGTSVMAIDIDDSRLEIAQQLGAAYILNAKCKNFDKQVKEVIPEGVDAVFEASGNPACIDMGFALCRREGKFVFQSDFGNDEITFNFRTPHAKRVTAYFPCDDGYQPCRRAVLDLIARGKLQWRRVITHKIKSIESPKFYTNLLNKDISGILGVVIDWSAQ